MTTGIIWFILLGSLYVSSAIILYRTSPFLSMAVMLLALLHCFIRAIWPSWSGIMKTRSTRSKVSACINKHLDVLARKRRYMVDRDDYGIVHYEAWDKEKDYFISNVLGGLFTDLHSQDFPLPVQRIDAMIEKRIDEHINKNRMDGAIREYRGETWEDEDRQAYRQYCTRLLGLAGWKVISDGGENSDGHVLALKGTALFALSCVTSSSPVGRRLIRNLSSSQRKHGAESAAVVTNSRYSRWARMVSTFYGVMLLHHEDLADIR